MGLCRYYYKSTTGFARTFLTTSGKAQKGCKRGGGSIINKLKQK